MTTSLFDCLWRFRTQIVKQISWQMSLQIYLNKCSKSLLFLKELAARNWGVFAQPHEYTHVLVDISEHLRCCKGFLTGYYFINNRIESISGNCKRERWNSVLQFISQPLLLAVILTEVGAARGEGLPSWIPSPQVAFGHPYNERGEIPTIPARISIHPSLTSNYDSTGSI